jgi:hypothetical protein
MEFIGLTAHSAGKKEFTVEEEKQSSEVEDQEADKSSAEQALDATADPASESEKGVPVAKHAALRQRAQAAERAQAFAEGQLAAIKEQTAAQAPTVKGPLQLEIERQAAEGIAEEDMTVSPRILIAQQAHDRSIAEQAATTKANETRLSKQRESTALSRVKHEDFDTVVNTGLALMTPGQRLDLENEVDNFGEVAYAKSQAIIAQNAKPESKTETAPEKEESKSETEEKVPSQDEILKGLNVDPVTEAVSKL